MNHTKTYEMCGEKDTRGSRMTALEKKKKTWKHKKSHN